MTYARVWWLPEYWPELDMGTNLRLLGFSTYHQIQQSTTYQYPAKLVHQ